MTFKTLLVALEIWQEYLLYCNATVLDMLDIVLHLCTAIIKWLSIFSYYKKKNLVFIHMVKSLKDKKSCCIYVQKNIYVLACFFYFNNQFIKATRTRPTF